MTASRRHARRQSGVTMVEFALVAPLFFLLVWGIIVMGLVVTNMVQVTNVARQGARLASICGIEQQQQPLPGPTGCGQIDSYVSSELVAIPAPLSISVTVCGLTGCQATSNCEAGSTVTVAISYHQPLYFPVIQSFFQTNADGTRTIQAQAEAACE